MGDAVNRSPVAVLLTIALASVLLAVRSDETSTPAASYTDGPITVAVDASDISRRIFQVRETIPVRPGKLTLLYPQWIPGHHSPIGPISKFAGLTVRAAGKNLPWHRDEFNVYAFHIDVPTGATSVDVEFQYLSPQSGSEGRVVMSTEILNLQWNAVSIYPAGRSPKQIQTRASVKLPTGWQLGSALDVAARDGDTTHFQPLSYSDLIDSPVFAGKYAKRIDLDPGAARPVHLNLFADEPKYLEVKPEQLQAHRNLVQQLYRLYGAQHFNHYEFLLTLSDKLSGVGIEHHRSSENGVSAGYFTEWQENWDSRDLLPHEFNHSWNGKYRRGSGQITNNFNVPLGDSLLWMYEGQTQFWGFVLAARAGLWDGDQFRQRLAATAATYDKGRPGLASWRTVQDTTNDPVIAKRQPLPYPSYQGSEDYYSAGLLIWLETDAKLRELTGGKKSLDDFGKAFFGMHSGSWDVLPYNFAEIVKTLNELAPYNWASHLRSRLDGHGPFTGGLAAHGWRLVYQDKRSAAAEAEDASSGSAELRYSLGLSAGKSGSVSGVVWESPAFRAGISPSMTITAVNGRDYSGPALKEAVVAAKSSNQPIELRVKNFDEERTVRIDYHGGLKYPFLERDAARPDTLSDLIRPR